MRAYVHTCIYVYILSLLLCVSPFSPSRIYHHQRYTCTKCYRSKNTRLNGLKINAAILAGLGIATGITLRHTGIDSVPVLSSYFNRKKTPSSIAIIKTEEEARELKRFRCTSCGFAIYPARGREDKFFSSGFRCPNCNGENFTSESPIVHKEIEMAATTDIHNISVIEA